MNNANPEEKELGAAGVAVIAIGGLSGLVQICIAAPVIPIAAAGYGAYKGGKYLLEKREREKKEITRKVDKYHNPKNTNANNEISEAEIAKPSHKGGLDINELI